MGKQNFKKRGSDHSVGERSLGGGGGATVMSGGKMAWLQIEDWVQTTYFTTHRTTLVFDAVINILHKYFPSGGVMPGRQVPTFQRTIPPPSSEQKKDGGRRFPQTDCTCGLEVQCHIPVHHNMKLYVDMLRRKLRTCQVPWNYPEVSSRLQRE
jgi:hypothetical protein